MNGRTAHLHTIHTEGKLHLMTRQQRAVYIAIGNPNKKSCLSIEHICIVPLVVLAYKWSAFFGSVPLQQYVCYMVPGALLACYVADSLMVFSAGGEKAHRHKKRSTQIFFPSDDICYIFITIKHHAYKKSIYH
jgi:hypothetical protein